MTTNLQETNNLEFKDKEGKWFAQIKGDATTLDNIVPFFITAAAVSSQDDSMPKMYVCFAIILRVHIYLL